MEGIKWHTETRKISELKEWEDNPIKFKLL